MNHWTEHYLELYAIQNVVSDTALNRILDLPMLDQLDALPSIEELSKAIDLIISAAGRHLVTMVFLLKSSSTVSKHY